MKPVSPMMRIAQRVQIARDVFQILAALRRLSLRAASAAARRPVLSVVLGLGAGIALARPWRRR